MPKDDMVNVVRTRNEFYRDNYYRIMAALLLSILMAAGLLFLLIYLISHPPKPRYFPVDALGRMTQLTPLNRPNVTSFQLLQWASAAAIATYTYNFVDYRRELQAASEFFTEKGWRDYITALKRSRNLEAVQKNELIVSAVPEQGPIIEQEGVNSDGIYAWKVTMPIVVTYQNQQQHTNQHLKVTMIIVRIDELNSARGIGIDAFQVESLGESNLN